MIEHEFHIPNNRANEPAYCMKARSTSSTGNQSPQIKATATPTATGTAAAANNPPTLIPPIVATTPVVAPPIDADCATAYILPAVIPVWPPTQVMSVAAAEPTAGPAGVNPRRAKTVVS